MIDTDNCFTHAFEVLNIPTDLHQRTHLYHVIRPDELLNCFDVVGETTDRQELLLPPEGAQAIAVVCNQFGQLGGDEIVGHMAVSGLEGLPVGQVDNFWVIRDTEGRLSGVGKVEPTLSAFPDALFGPDGMYPAHHYTFLRVKNNVLNRAGI